MATGQMLMHRGNGAQATTTIEKPEIWYDYELQVWVVRDIVSRCGHPDIMRTDSAYCCNQYRYAGMWIWEARDLAGLCACFRCIEAQWRDQAVN